MAQEIFNFIIQTREAFIRLVNSLSVEELNQIPAGFNNNIIWNFGHIVVTTPALCYVRTGIWTDVSAIKYWNEFKKDSKPSRDINEEEIAELKALAISSIESIKEDYKKGIFNSVTPFATATYGADMNSFEEILVTTVGHDNMHLGYALAQRKLIIK
ncbi:DinB family protein [Pedobacter alpinus]|uniref:DinB family protein n=1 Tax=Pedobacter alpinus TaxID=1590643 RepID=A0ABW5TZ31_9SPHI